MTDKSSHGRPNVLVIMTDQERYPPPYEAGLAEYRRRSQPARERLRASGVEMHRHYIGSAACVPSRATLFTGQYPSLHGVTDTDGLAKSPIDPGVSWLDPDTVPTMGDWFRAAGYRTHYRGKWHVSHADLVVPGTHTALMANLADGTLVEDAIDLYRRTDRLDPFGFSGWIGREPHGADPADSGTVRDGVFADQVTTLFDELAASRDEGPWLCVASFVNPHDIVFTGAAWGLLGFPPVGDDVPEVPEAPSQSDGFEGRPTCHEGIRAAWHAMTYPQPTDLEYRRLYHWLHAQVDVAIMAVLDGLERGGFADDTIVVLTSDHGEMLGAHGGMQQKWHNAFDETTRVPMVVSGPGIEPIDDGITAPTSHLDLLPTLLGLVGADADELAERIGATHTEAQPLVGRDLSALVTGGDADSSDGPVYFMTEDEISSGLNQIGLFTREPYPSVPHPSKVESIVAHRPTGGDGAPELWKLNRYYEHVHVDPEVDGTVWELHNLTSDPEERTNLSGTGLAVEAELGAALVSERERCRRRPAHTNPRS